MAQKYTLILEDDLDGTSADETIQFAFEGTEYEIDLNTQHAKELRDSLSPFVNAARKIHPKQRRSTRPAAAKSGPSASDVRAWAQEQNMDVNPFGRVKQSIIDAYIAAH